LNPGHLTYWAQPFTTWLSKIKIILKYFSAWKIKIIYKLQANFEILLSLENKNNGEMLSRTFVLIIG
jgi:hypothetical protein